MPSEPPRLPDHLETRRKALPLDLAFAHRQGSFDVWRQHLDAAWRRDLPPHEGMPEATRDGDSVTLRFATGAVAEGRFERPAGPGPHPAVLLLHDHGGAFEIGWKKPFDLPESQAGLTRHFAGIAPASAFLNAGFAVLCVDAPGWGGRRFGTWEDQQALAAGALGLGWSLPGLVVAEDVQAAAWLAAQPEVDSSRVGAFGFSFGGFRAWQAAALSSHIRSAVSLSWMARRADLMRPGAPLMRGQSAFWFLNPSLAARADFPDLAGLAAGKPLLFGSGSGDPHMPEDSVKAAWQTIETICNAAGGPRPEYVFHDRAHTCPPGVLSQSVAFLSAALA